MSILLPQCIPPEYQEKAEDIRAYLVQVRGGAPFLSGADGKLLVQWLDSEIPVAAILSAIDQVSIRRRARPVRSRMSLNVCKGTLKKLLKKSSKKSKIILQPTGLASLIPSIQQMDVPSLLQPAKSKLIQKIQLLSKEEITDHEKLADHAIQACLEFHHAAWNTSLEEHEKLQQDAEEELAALASLFSPIKWREAVEEVMRSKLRMRYPAISAQVIWNVLNQSP